MMTIQKYVRVRSLQEAYELNQNKRNRILGGMLWLKMTKATVPVAIDLSDLGLDIIEETEESFSIGAMVSLRQLELHPGLHVYTHGELARSLRDIVGVQFRNMATIGGSIFGRFGFSDVLTMFLSMDTWVELYKGGLVPLEKFVDMPRDRDILVRVIVKKHPGSFAYRAMRNSRTDFPVIACAASCMEGEYRLVIGARPGKAMVLHDSEGLLTAGVNDASAGAFADFAAAKVPTGSNVRGSADYRTHLIRVLSRRVMMELGGMKNGN